MTAVLPEIAEELQRLRARVPQVNGALVATADGLLLAQDDGAEEPESLAALTATALSVARRLLAATAQGLLSELLVRGANGCVATYSAGSSAVLTVVAGQDTVTALLHREARRAAADLGDLIDGALTSGPDGAETP
ncbi:diacylglyceryl transferase [Streptomyces sp. A7024]|uniref:Diacylglyceryl transferase n=1 Tax=Streptomyces coryli TaxID=1128680 RepID=A0A6G4U2G3_9ACTN|nr:diacylglyceryl transferase [Streptomyces coryli]